MQYLVSFALLVALAAWMVGVYNHLVHLRRVVCTSWGQWRQATHRRNSCLADFAAVYASFLPQNAPVPLQLKRLAEDSEHALTLVHEPRWSRVPGFLGCAEQLLRRAVADSVHAVEDSPELRSQVHLQNLCSTVSASIYQQDQFASAFNHAAREYNSALSTPSARLLAPLFGFQSADPL